MSKALSVDLRVRVLAAVSEGQTHWQAGKRFGRLHHAQKLSATQRRFLIA